MIYSNEEDQANSKKSKEVQLKLTKTRSKNISLNQAIKRKNDLHDKAEQPKMQKQNSKIQTFDDYNNKQDNVEQPRLFKFKIRNKENFLSEKKTSVEKNDEAKKNNNPKSFLTGIYNF